MDDREIVANALSRYHATHPFPDVAKSPPYAPEDGGVPPSMFDGEVSADGWVRWRLLPSRVSQEDFNALEQTYGVRFPPLFRAYYTTYSHMFDQLNNGRVYIILPEAPDDQGLAPLAREIGAWEPLISLDYIPFGEFSDGWGPLCFDRLSETSDGDYAIVWLDHELIPDPDAAQFTRSVVSRLARPLYPSFRALFVDHFVEEAEPSSGA